MYYIRKFADCWAIYDDDTGKSRPLTRVETNLVMIEFPTLEDKDVKTIFADHFTSIDPGL